MRSSLSLSLSLSLSAVRRRLLAALLAILLSPLAHALAQGPGATATVRRDEHGVPHIVANNEETAWYALGYEQARDGLLWLQYACKAAKGELAWVRGDSFGVKNDLAVKILGSHLGGLSVAERRSLLASGTPGISANFYDNCVAFAAGANAYRLAVQAATTTSSPPTREELLRAWLSDPANRFPARAANFPAATHDLSWVYNDPIDPVDIASQGGYTSAIWSFSRPELALVNSNGVGYTDDDAAAASAANPTAVDPKLVGDPLDPSSALDLLEQQREYASRQVGMASAMSGSNSFGWSSGYCRDPATGIGYSGLVADPHQGLPFTSPNFMADFARIPNHMWMAHVQVTPTGASEPTLDVFGHVPYGAAAHQSNHNRTLAMGGTAGAPNHTDHFVLRLEEDSGSQGTPANPVQFYSYYHDPSGTNSVYRPIQEVTITIRRPGDLPGQGAPLKYWRAESFGVILPNLTLAAAHIATYDPATPTNPPPMPIYHGERVEPGMSPPAWRVDTRANPAPPKMRYWASPQYDEDGLPITSPMVVTLRAPMDGAVAGNPRVAGEDRHWQLARDFWVLSHAATVHDVFLIHADRTNGGTLPVNLCFADSDGRTMTTQLGPIPQRGDDAQLAAAGYSAVDKFAFYSQALGPVPARHSEDRMFDWVFGGFTNPSRPDGLNYLPYPPAAAMHNVSTPFKAMTIQDPAAAAFPPFSSSGTGPTFEVDGGMFASACNDPPWGYSRLRDEISWNNAPTGPNGLNNLTTDNWLLTRVLDLGVAYQATALSFEPPVNQQIVIDRFLPIAEQFVFYTTNSYPQPNPPGEPPMTPAEMREFVVSPKAYSARDYVPLPSLGSFTTDPNLTAPVRQLKEVVDNQAHPASPLERAEKEVKFFRDLWTELFDPNSQWASHSISPTGEIVDLRRVWIHADQPGHVDQIFWYATDSDPYTVKWIDMPPDFPLIDFLWTESEVGRNSTVGDMVNGTSITALDGLDWTLFTGAVNSTLVPWDQRSVPDSVGACLLEMMRMGYNGSGSFARKWVWLTRGAVHVTGPTSPVQLDPLTGALPSGAGNPVPQEVKWSTLRHLAFPDYQRTTLFTGGLEPPYDALYDLSGQVRATLGPAETNAIVEFFLKLGGHYIEPGYNGDSPSRKLARWELAQAVGPVDPAAAFRDLLPGSYPLTAGLERMTVVRALLDAWGYLGHGSPQFRDHFGARAYDFDNNGQEPHVWPETNYADYVGQGLRSAVWLEDTSQGSGRVPGRGYQPKFLGMGGSYATLLTMFPTQGDVESYFWCTPGVEAMGDDPARFDKHMAAHASNVLLRSHFSDFANSPVSASHVY